MGDGTAGTVLPRDLFLQQQGSLRRDRRIRGVPGLPAVPGCGDVHPLPLVHAAAVPAGGHQRPVCPGEAAGRSLAEGSHAQTPGAGHPRPAGLPLDGGILQHRGGRAGRRVRRGAGRGEILHHGVQRNRAALVRPGAVAAGAGAPAAAGAGPEGQAMERVREGALREMGHRAGYPAGHPLLAGRADTRPQPPPRDGGRALEPVQAAVLPDTVPAGILCLLARCGPAESPGGVGAADGLRRGQWGHPRGHHLRAGQHQPAVPGQPA